MPSNPLDPREIAATSLETLLEGNRRFAASTPHAHPLLPDRRAELLNGQYPLATLIGCVDARVPPELVFDQGIGDLLTVRTAGQSLTGSALGSIEFGVQVLGVPLVIVMGHTGCGAVAAALSASRPDGNLGDLVGEVADRLTELVGGDPLKATAGNTAATVDVLRRLGSLVTPAGDDAIVVGLLYDMATGLVAVLDDGGLGIGTGATTA